MSDRAPTTRGPDRRRRRRDETRHERADRRSRRRTAEAAAHPVDERRPDLLDAAAAAIRRDGPGVSMEDIAREAGVTKPIIYRHFGDRDGLVDALSRRFVTDLMERLSRALAADAAPRELVAAGIDAYLGLVEDDPNLYRFLLQRTSGRADAADVLHGVMAEAGRQVAVVIGERLRAVGADSGAAEPWAFGLVGMVHAAGHWWLDHRTMSRTDLVGYLTTLAWDGMAVAVPDGAADDAPGHTTAPHSGPPHGKEQP